MVSGAGVNGALLWTACCGWGAGDAGLAAGLQLLAQHDAGGQRQNARCRR